MKCVHNRCFWMDEDNFQHDLHDGFSTSHDQTKHRVNHPSEQGPQHERISPFMSACVKTHTFHTKVFCAVPQSRAETELHWLDSHTSSHSHVCQRWVIVEHYTRAANAQLCLTITETPGAMPQADAVCHSASSIGQSPAEKPRLSLSDPLHDQRFQEGNWFQLAHTDPAFYARFHSHQFMNTVTYWPP